MPPAAARCRPARRPALHTWLRYRLPSAPPPCGSPSRGRRAECEARSRHGWRSGSFRTLGEDEKRLAVFDRLAILNEDRLHRAGGIGLDLVHQLHCLDDANRVPLLYRLADFDESLRVRRWRPVERSDHRRFDDVAFLRWLRLARGRGPCRRTSLCGGRRGGSRCRDHDTALYDLDLLLAFSDLELGDARLLHEIDQLLQLA